MKGKISKYYNELINGTKIMFKEFFSKETNKKQRANMWTFLRLISPIFVILCTILSIIIKIPLLFSIGGIIAGFGGLTDFFDGRSARKHNSSSEYGKKLDQFTDKVFAGLLAINLAIINPIYISLLVGELSIALINLGFKSKFSYVNDKSSNVGRIKQWPLFASLFIGFFIPSGNITLTLSKILCYLTTVLQALTIIDYTSRHIKCIKNHKIENKPCSVECCDFKEEEKDKIKEKSKNLNNNKTKKEELINLRNVLLNIKNKKEIEENKINEEKQKQKVIKL